MCLLLGSTNACLRSLRSSPLQAFCSSNVPRSTEFRELIQCLLGFPFPHELLQSGSRLLLQGDEIDRLAIVSVGRENPPKHSEFRAVFAVVYGLSFEDLM